MKEYVVNGETTLKKFTDNVCAPASFCFRALLKAKEIRVNGKKVGNDLPLQTGDIVRYYLTASQEGKRGFSIAYRDENVIVTDKESGVNSEAVFSALAEEGECYFIHRLDRNTAGLLIFARTAEAEEELLSAFRERRTKKIYLARVLGSMPERRAIEEAYLVKDELAAKVRVGLRPCGEKIVTEYEVLSRTGETSVLKVILHTGKTHQIRAHLAFLGHPVAGDEKYGNEAYNRKNKLTRQQLIAKELAVEGKGVLAYLNGKTFVSEKNL
ncbi:MAG: RluA family pseudouridine synthase [Clostridia bacterium]|nr:RluA family pseudouridine synthase [Clostridia bacterium]